MTKFKKHWRLRSSWWRPAPRSIQRRPCGASSPAASDFSGTPADAAYVEWLAAARGITPKEALAYCEAMDRRKLISSHHATSAPIQASIDTACAA